MAECEHDWKRFTRMGWSEWDGRYSRAYWRCTNCGETGHLIPADA